MARKNLKEVKAAFLKLYAEAQRDLGMDNLTVEIWSEGSEKLIGYNSQSKKITRFCEITVR